MFREEPSKCSFAGEGGRFGLEYGWLSPVEVVASSAAANRVDISHPASSNSEIIGKVNKTNLKLQIWSLP